MPRAMNNVAARRRRKKVLKQAKGSYSGRRKLYKNAKETVMRGLVYAYRDRRQKKRLFRRLWIARINAASRSHDLSYSRLINGLSKANVTIDRKMMADLAVNDAVAFARIVETAKAALAQYVRVNERSGGEIGDTFLTPLPRRGAPSSYWMDVHDACHSFIISRRDSRGSACRH